MTTTAPNVSIVIPTLNEAGTIGDLIEALEEFRDVYQLRIIIVDDGSTDGTLQIIENNGKKFGNIILIERGRKLGLGTAIKEGMKTALSQAPEPDLIVTMDADLSHNPEDLPNLINKCEKDSQPRGSSESHQ